MGLIPSQAHVREAADGWVFFFSLPLSPSLPLFLGPMNISLDEDKISEFVGSQSE